MPAAGDAFSDPDPTPRIRRNRLVRFALAVSLMALLGTQAVSADTEPDYVPGPWHYHAITCIDTTVVAVTPRLSNGASGHYTAADFQSGAMVEYDTGLGIVPLFPTGHAAIVHYGDEPGNTVMGAEHVGDKVQVCYLGGPAPTSVCNPDKDNRGRSYRVYDYRQKQQYWGYNSEHLCGGA
jgi:hypothetical protein